MSRTLLRPMVGLPLLTWAALAALVHWLTPAVPAHRFDLEGSMRAFHAQEVKDANKGWILPPELAFSPDGGTLISSHQSGNQVRFWNLKAGDMKSVTPVVPLGNYPLTDLTPDADVWLINRKPESRLAGMPDFLAGRMSAMRRNKDDAWDFVHWQTGKTSRLVTSPHVRSASGRLVAYTDGLSNHLLDLTTQEQRLFFVIPTVEQSPLVPFSPRCFSEDERFLAGVKDEFIVVVEIKSGAIVATLPYRMHDDKHSVSRLSLAPDGQAILWEMGDTLVISPVTDKRTERSIILNGRLTGWLPSGNVLLTNRPWFAPSKMSQLEVWDWRKRESVATHPRPSHNGAWGFVEVTHARDVRRVLVADTIQKHAPAPWMQKLRGWLRLPVTEHLELEVTVLDGEKLTPLARLEFPVQAPQNALIHLTADEQHVVYTDGRIVEHWPIGGRSWTPSVLITGGGTLAILSLVFAWRTWRRRSRDIMTPAFFAQASGFDEVPHAQT